MAAVSQAVSITGEPLRRAVCRSPLDLCWFLPPLASRKRQFHGSKVPEKEKNSRKGVSRVVAFATGVRERSLQAEIEQRWQKVNDNPLEGLTFSIEEFEGALSKYEYSIELGDVVQGTVFVGDSRGAFIDIGAKAPAYLPIVEACLHKIKGLDEMGLYPGVRDEFTIVDEDDKNGRMIVSLRRLQEDLAWDRVRQIHAEDVTVKGKILSANRGGIVLITESLRAFLPFSQTTPGKNTEEWVGRELSLKIIEVDEEQNRLVVSNRKAQAESHISLGIGSVVLGTIQTVKPYGVFVDLGGVNGLLHISQVSHERVTTLDNIFQPGDKLKVMILSQDKERDRISLSTKKLEPTPGDMLRNPALVFERADEMAMSFRQRIAQAEAAARIEDTQFDDTFSLSTDFLAEIASNGPDKANPLSPSKGVATEDFLSNIF